MELSVLVPCLNEADNLPELVARIAAVFRDSPAWAERAELVLVDDGSTDETFALMEAARAASAFVVTARHAQNLGLPAAWRTALSRSRGRLVCILDADLQYRPEDLPRLHQTLIASGADVAQGTRAEVGRERGSRYLFSRGLNRLLNGLFSMDLADNKSGFLLCRREVLADILDYRGRYRYWQILIMVAAHCRGYRIVEVETPFLPRRAGKSFLSSVPLRVMAGCGADLVRGFLEYQLGVR